MTTAALQHNFPHVYDQFYREHDLVLSLPLQFRRVHDTPMGCDSLLIKQQLPTNIYLGLTPQKRSGVFFGSAFVYDNHIGFVKQPIEELIGHNKFLLLRQKIELLLLADGYAGGFSCDIISEQLQGYGFGFMGILCTSLACATYLLSGKLTIDQLQDDQFASTDLAKEIMRRSIELDISIGGSPTGISAHLSLMKCAQPVVQFGSASALTVAGTVATEYEHNVILPLSDVFELPEQVSMPIDYGVISLGLDCDEEEMKLGALHFAYSYKEIHSYWSTLKNKFSLPDEMDIPAAFPMNILGKSLKLSLLQHRERMIKNPMNAIYTEAFIQRIGQVGTQAVMLEKQEQQLVDVYNQFYTSKKTSTESLGLIPMSTIRAGGLILFVCHKAQSRQTIDKVIEQLHAQGYEDAQAIYQSRRDGNGGEGCALQQWLSKKVYSSYVPAGSKILVTTQGVHQVVIEDKTNGSWGTSGVIIDQARGKVHVPHIKLTHKDLPSQLGTAEIIGRLIENPGKAIANTTFSASSYSKNKNEMMGKIVLPMIRLIKTHFGEEIDIECEGTLFNFALKLRDDKGIFHLVKPLVS